jgi:maleamate amidohydrolase
MTDSAKSVYARGGFGGSILADVPVALLVVDFCNAFLDPDMLGGGNIGKAAERTQVLLSEARLHGWPIAHSKIAYKQDGSDANNALPPQPGELVIQKTVPSAFFGSDLDSWLKVRGVKGLIIAGCTTSGCVRASAVDALSLGIRTVLVSD